MTRINVLVLMILCVLQIHLGDVVVAVVVDEGLMVMRKEKRICSCGDL